MNTSLTTLAAADLIGTHFRLSEKALRNAPDGFDCDFDYTIAEIDEYGRFVIIWSEPKPGRTTYRVDSVLRYFSEGDWIALP